MRTGPLLAAALFAAPLPAAAAGDEPCELCFENFDRGFRAGEAPALKIEIESGIGFSRMALKGRTDGEAEIDPQTGTKRVDGNMVDLGGVAFEGRARVTGEPLRPVRIEMPPTVKLRAPNGAEAELRQFTTNLPAMPMLDENGVLQFAFGARIASRGAQGGNFRGRIPIRVEYF